MDQLLSGRQAAKVIGVSYLTVYNLIRKGDLKPAATSISPRGKRTGFWFDPEYIRDFAASYRDGRLRKSA